MHISRIAGPKESIIAEKKDQFTWLEITLIADS